MRADPGFDDIFRHAAFNIATGISEKKSVRDEAIKEAVSECYWTNFATDLLGDEFADLLGWTGRSGQVHERAETESFWNAFEKGDHAAIGKIVSQLIESTIREKVEEEFDEWADDQEPDDGDHAYELRAGK